MLFRSRPRDDLYDLGIDDGGVGNAFAPPGGDGNVKMPPSSGGADDLPARPPPLVLLVLDSYDDWRVRASEARSSEYGGSARAEALLLFIARVLGGVGGDALRSGIGPRPSPRSASSLAFESAWSRVVFRRLLSTLKLRAREVGFGLTFSFGDSFAPPRRLMLSDERRLTGVSYTEVEVDATESVSVSSPSQGAGEIIFILGPATQTT